MHKCYSCGTDLKDSSLASEKEIAEGKISSQEHIILNSIGGRLKTKEFNTLLIAFVESGTIWGG